MHRSAGLALVLLACGARTPLAADHDAGAAAPRDAGARDGGMRDAGDVPPMRRDAGLPDAGPPPTEGCTLELRVPPTTIFTERSGSFHAPQVEVRGGLVDLFATFLPDTDDRIPQPYGHRFDLALASAEGLSGPTRPATAMYTAKDVDTLGVCFQDTRTRRPAIAVFEPGAPSRGLPLGVPEGECLGLAGGGGRWMVAHDSGDESPPEPFWTVFGRDGAFVTMPRPFFPPGVRDARVAVTAFRAGFAWVGSESSRGELVVGVTPNGFEITEVRLPEVPWVPGGPAIAPGTFDRATIAIAVWAFGLRVIVIDPDAGVEVARSDSLAFSMQSDVRPALVATRSATIVAAKGYGDIDPFGGNLDVIAVDARGRALSSLSLPTRRNDFRAEGIDLATDGDLVVAHWSEVEGDPTGVEVPITRAMVLECVR